MHTFFTADLHLGGANSILYFNRPFSRGRLSKDGGWASREDVDDALTDMNNTLIYNWNQRVAPADTVIHVGDFCVRGNENGVRGSRDKPMEWEDLLNGRIVHILGNHDPRNGLKRGFKSASMRVCGLNAYIVHIPPGPESIPDGTEIILCGHVHNRWTCAPSDYKMIPMLNVGVDAHGMFPLREDEIRSIYDSVVRNGYQKV